MFSERTTIVLSCIVICYIWAVTKKGRNKARRVRTNVVETVTTIHDWAQDRVSSYLLGWAVLTLGVFYGRQRDHTMCLCYLLVSSVCQKIFLGMPWRSVVVLFFVYSGGLILVSVITLPLGAVVFPITAVCAVQMHRPKKM